MKSQDELEAMMRLWESKGSGGGAQRATTPRTTPRDYRAKASPINRLIFELDVISL